MPVERHNLPPRVTRSAIVLAALIGVLGAGSVRAAAPRIASESKVFDFGTVNDVDAVEHTFVVRNEGDADLVISRVKTSCGCTTTKLTTPHTVPPGESVEITATLSLKGRSGRQHKTITVESNDSEEPRYRLEMKGDIHNAIDVRPQHAVFQISSDSRPEAREVTITFNTPSPFHVTRLETNNLDCCSVKLEETEPGRVYKLVFALRPEFNTDRSYETGRVRVHTDHPRTPTLNVPVSVSVIRDVLVSPPQVTLKAGGEAASPANVYVRNRVSTPLEIVKVDTPDPGAIVTRQQLNPQVYRLSIAFPAVTPSLDGRSIVIHTRQENGDEEAYEIPIRVLAE